MSSENPDPLASEGLQSAAIFEDERREDRLPLHLKVAIVYQEQEDAATRQTFHGRTNDISHCGLSVLLENNVFIEGQVVVLVAVPPEKAGDSLQIVEATATRTYTVFSSEHKSFRIGLVFESFKRSDETVLRDYLDKRRTRINHV